MQNPKLHFNSLYIFVNCKHNTQINSFVSIHIVTNKRQKTSDLVKILVQKFRVQCRDLCQHVAVEKILFDKFSLCMNINVNGFEKIFKKIHAKMYRPNFTKKITFKDVELLKDIEICYNQCIINDISQYFINNRVLLTRKSKVKLPFCMRIRISL